MFADLPRCGQCELSTPGCEHVKNNEDNNEGVVDNNSTNWLANVGNNVANVNEDEQ